jgi:hypothetical protein
MDLPGGELRCGPSGGIGPSTGFRGRLQIVERALTPARIASIDDAFVSECEAEADDLGLVAGLRFAIPLGLGIWALLIWSVFHFIV